MLIWDRSQNIVAPEHCRGQNMGINLTPAKRTPVIPSALGPTLPAGSTPPGFWPGRHANRLDSPCVIVRFTNLHVRLD
jgi:hypothetical protein